MLIDHFYRTSTQTPNQALLTTSNQIRVEEKLINLDKVGTTLEALDLFIRQIMSKLMEFNSVGKDVKQKVIQIIEKLNSRVNFKDEVEEIKNLLIKTYRKLKDLQMKISIQKNLNYQNQHNLYIKYKTYLKKQKNMQQIQLNQLWIHNRQNNEIIMSQLRTQKNLQRKTKQRQVRLNNLLSQNI